MSDAGDEQDRAERYDEEVVGDPTVDEREHPDDEERELTGGDAVGLDPEEDPLVTELREAALLDELEERAHHPDDHHGLDPETLRLAHDAGLDDDAGDEAREVWRSSHPPQR